MFFKYLLKNNSLARKIAEAEYESIIKVFSLEIRGLSTASKKKAMSNESLDTIPASGKHKIAIIQLTCGSSKAENFETSQRLIEQAKQNGALMAFLPEACDFIESSTKNSIEKSEPLDGQFIGKYQKLAAQLKIWISIGSFHRKVRPPSFWTILTILTNMAPIKGCI
jgi:hypothetical protein